VTSRKISVLCGRGRPFRGTRDACLIVAVLLIGVGVTGCSREETPPVADVDYSGWQLTTPARLDFPVPGHGSGLRKIFVNEAGLSAGLDATGDVVYPDGTIFLKEVYAEKDPGPDTDPQMLTVMVKAQEDPRSIGGWLWVVRDPAAGTESVSGEGFCIGCHESANEAHPYGTGNPDGSFRDYIFHTPAVEAAEERASP
jgi:hypothetical protein